MDDAPSNSPEAGTAAVDSGRRARGPRRLFYGWWIVGAGLSGQTVHAALYTLGAAALFLPVAREFGTSRTIIAGVLAAAQLEGGLTGPIEGFLIHWIGPRRYMIVGWVVFGAGLIAIGLSQNVLQFYAAFLLTALGQSMAGFLPVVTTLMNWFLKKRGRAIAIFQMGTSLGALLVPAYAWSILNVGWRPTTIAAGIAAIVVGVPLALTIRNRPEDHGLLPDGAPAQAPTATVTGGRPQDAPRGDGTGTTVAQVLRSRSFWFLGTAHAASLLTWGALRIHQIPALVDLGIDEQMAANVFSLTLTVAAAGRLLGGFLGDFLGVRRVLFFAILSQSVAMVLLAFASTVVHALAIAVIFGIAFGARGTLLTVLRGEVFGRKNFSRLAGLMDPLTTIGSVTAPLFAAYAFDTQGTYTGAFLILAAVGGFGAILLYGIRMPARA